MSCQYCCSHAPLCKTSYYLQPSNIAAPSQDHQHLCTSAGSLTVAFIKKAKELHNTTPQRIQRRLTRLALKSHNHTPPIPYLLEELLRSYGPIVLGLALRLSRLTLGSLFCHKHTEEAQKALKQACTTAQQSFSLLLTRHLQSRLFILANCSPHIHPCAARSSHLENSFTAYRTSPNKNRSSLCCYVHYRIHSRKTLQSYCLNWEQLQRQLSLLLVGNLTNPEQPPFPLGDYAHHVILLLQTLLTNSPSFFQTSNSILEEHLLTCILQSLLMLGFTIVDSNGQRPTHIEQHRQFAEIIRGKAHSIRVCIPPKARIQDTLTLAPNQQHNLLAALQKTGNAFLHFCNRATR